MIEHSELLLVGAVAAVGVLHTVVPDHWVPITLIARQQGWTRREVARAATIAGTGHTVSTLIIGLVVWFAGVAFATKFGNLVSIVSSIALIAFGAWIALSSLRELRASIGHGHRHGHDPSGGGNADDYIGPHLHRQHEHSEQVSETRDPLYAPSRAGTAVVTTHTHAHRHARSIVHVHFHDHDSDTCHPEGFGSTDAPAHNHPHKRSLRTTLLLILGSSPMVEGIPAFFAAAKFGPGLIAVMAVVFAVATIGTYVALCVSSVAGLQQVRFGSLERYGEVLSGAFIATVGVVFLIFPIL